MFHTNFSCCDMMTKVRITTKDKEPKTSKATMGNCETGEKKHIKSYIYDALQYNCTLTYHIIDAPDSSSDMESLLVLSAWLSGLLHKNTENRITSVHLDNLYIKNIKNTCKLIFSVFMKQNYNFCLSIRIYAQSWCHYLIQTSLLTVEYLIPGVFENYKVTPFVLIPSNLYMQVLTKNH